MLASGEMRRIEPSKDCGTISSAAIYYRTPQSVINSYIVSWPLSSAVPGEPHKAAQKMGELRGVIVTLESYLDKTERVTLTSVKARLVLIEKEPTSQSHLLGLLRDAAALSAELEGIVKEGHMEQSVLETLDRRWVDAVAKMTQMTYAGRLKWDRTDRTDTATSTSDTFVTVLSKQAFTLIVTTVKTDGMYKSKVPAKRLVGFQVFQDGSRIKLLENLTVLEALADAVFSMSNDRQTEEDILKVIESL